jgi:N-acyl-L-homoserine lactone synthetase
MAGAVPTFFGKVLPKLWNPIEGMAGAVPKMWNASRFCVSSLRRGHANLLCIVPILVYVLPKQVQHWMQINSSRI